jgi:hypothetical protein
MSEQTQLKVAIPYIFATDGWTSELLRAHVRTLMRQNGGTDFSRYLKEPFCTFIDAVFPDRSKAVNAVKAIRKLSLEHPSESAKNFTYIIDNEELLLFTNEDDEYSFHSKSVTDAIQEYEISCGESPVVS